MFAGVDHGCLSCIFKFQTQATGASTTGEKCFVCYTEYNTQGIHENSKLLFFSFAKQKIIEKHIAAQMTKHMRGAYEIGDFMKPCFLVFGGLFFLDILLYGVLCAKLRANMYT